MTGPNNERHLQHHDDYKCEYNFGYLLRVDGVTGECRCFNNHHPGAKNDLKKHYSSGLQDDLALCFGLGDEALADETFARIDEN